MKTILMIDGRRDGYSPNQCKGTMTVGELRDYLEYLDDDTPVLLKNDNGYTYGRITRSSFEEEDFDDDDDYDDEDGEEEDDV